MLFLLYRLIVFVAPYNANIYRIFKNKISGNLIKHFIVQHFYCNFKLLKAITFFTVCLLISLRDTSVLDLISSISSICSLTIQYYIYVFVIITVKNRCRDGWSN